MHTMYTARLCYNISVVILQFLVDTCDPIDHILSYSITLKPDRQEGCRGSGQISERCTHSKTQSRTLQGCTRFGGKMSYHWAIRAIWLFPDWPTLNGVNLMDVGILTISHVLNQNNAKANAHHMPNSRALPYVCCHFRVILVPSLNGIRADFRLAPSQWETSLQSNAVSHWLGANLESALGISPFKSADDFIHRVFRLSFS